MDRHRPFTNLVAAATLLLLAACAHPAASVVTTPLVTDRPDFTESAVTIPKGYTQVEMGGTYSREDGVRSLSTGETLVRAGLSRRVELRITTASYAVERDALARQQGLEDSGIGFKFALHEGPEGPSIVPTLAVIVGTSLPTGADAFRGTRALPEVKLLGAWTLSDRVGFASNANWARAEDLGPPHDEFSGSASFAFTLTDKVGAYTEFFTFGERMITWQHRSYVNGGLTYLINDSFQLDGRAGVRTDAAASGVFFGLGLSRRF